ncbi:MAG: acetyl/propionyl/methylcrotonyl-CoA carboxylase subunit alpha [Candidatus Puniceispirillales bacterium WSBS_2018_MAG_OTU23]
MINRILIANRGEIACRIIRTAKMMGIETVAVYSEPDTKARHRHLADHAVAIGGDSPASSYLDKDKIIAAAISSGADAIHPGYGFLSENPEFVEAAEAAGLIFIGPTADAMRAMGLKDRAKQLMDAAGIPVVPGYDGKDQSPDLLSRKADEIGYPVMIKARAGGGGKGMRRVENAADFRDALSSTKREAASSFGDDHVLLEKCINKPRHIEIQIFADTMGNTVHLFERDCTLQRRHQKVIEEAPAPGMNDETRRAMTIAAVTAAKAINYRGAGTVEFITDGSDGLKPDQFWFMEMNTRLQVEHPVTEMITGYDLVEWQILVASGKPLPVSQDDITINGHAIEARIYAEDAAAGFLPTPGVITYAEFPQSQRVDHGISTSDQISPFYDPMIAKVIANGHDRKAAMGAVYQALGATHIHGTVVNTSFLQTLINHQDVIKMTIDTTWIDRNLNGLNVEAALDDVYIAIMAITVAAADGAFVPIPHTQSGFRIWGHAQIMVRFALNKAIITRRITLFDDMVVVDLMAGEDGASSIQFSRVAHNADDAHDPSALTITNAENGLNYSVQWRDFFGQISVVVNNQRIRVNRIDRRDSQNHVDGGTRVIAPMTGIIRIIETAVGDKVKAGDVLVRMEAMKMEHALTAPCDGTISSINCGINETVNDSMVLAEIKQDDA